MKKIFTSMLALVAAVGFTASAGENIKCYVDGQEVVNGDRIDITKFYEELSLEGFGVYARQYNTHLVVVPTVADEMTAVVDFIKNDTPLDDNNEFGANMAVQFCGFGQCYNINVGDKHEESKDFKADEEIDMQTELKVLNVGTAADFTELAISAEFSLTLTLDEEVVALTFYVDQQGVDAAVEGIEADNNTQAIYYDLQGRKVNNPSKGIFIVKKGNKVTKEIVM